MIKKSVINDIQYHKSKKSHKSKFGQLHGGEIKVETKEGEGSGFIIQLPLKDIA